MLTVFNRGSFPVATSRRHKTADGNSWNLPISLYNDLHPFWTVCFLKQCRVAFTHSQSINPTNVDCGLTPCQEPCAQELSPTLPTQRVLVECTWGLYVYPLSWQLWSPEKTNTMDHAFPLLGILRVREGKQLASDTEYIAQSRLNLGEQDPFIH